VLPVDAQRLFVSVGYMAGLRPGEERALVVATCTGPGVDA